MGSINWGRVFLGGLLAGVVANVGEYVLNEIVLKQAWAEALAALGLPAEQSTQQMLVWILYGFLVGWVAVWGYAAMRPRYGPGPKTAVCAGLAVWFLVSALWALGMWNMGLAPVGPLLIAVIWALIEIPVATVAGAWLYRET